MAENKMTHENARHDSLKDKIILVSGAGDGIGAAVSRAYAAHGATVILLGRTQKKLEKVYDLIEDAGHPQPAIFPMDLLEAKPSAYRQLAETIEREFGHLDGLLHNAAILGTLTPIEHYDLRLWSQVIQVNLNAPFLLSRACLPLLKQSSAASILFTTAAVGIRGQAYWGAYAVTKAANENLMQILAEELEANTHIRVNSIDPGPVRTRMHSLAYPGDDPNKLPAPDDITDVYVYLMSNACDGVTGEHFLAQD
jgi:NAD(P)-dependent dehydrogenase (short-subunit alcohol dehydrogenase family)